MRSKKFALAIILLMLTFAACLIVEARDSHVKVSGVEPITIIYPDITISGDRATDHVVLSQPKCGSVTPVIVNGAMAFRFDRSAGVAAGEYKFTYGVSGWGDMPGILTNGARFTTQQSADATITVAFSDTVPSPGQEDPCNIQHKAFIGSASDSGSYGSRAASISWSVPDTSEFGDIYKITILDQNSGATLGSVSFASPGGHAIQSSKVPHLQATLLTIVLETIKGGAVVFTDTLSGVQGAPLEYIPVDDYVRLDRGGAGRAEVDVFANDFFLNPKLRNVSARPSGDQQGFLFHKVVNERGEEMMVILLTDSVDPGEYVIPWNITMYLPMPDRSVLTLTYQSNLYIEVAGPDFTVRDDYLRLERGAKNNALASVLANDGGIPQWEEGLST
ncbi:MAG: hypothetical protein OEZ04_07660 [Nitrospinota bacterium]|nr:hypothetical protein [Nitrospinota bacterium]